MSTINVIKEKVLNQERISIDEGEKLLNEGNLGLLGSLGNFVRFKKSINQVVTYVLDANPNYTNICGTGCHFCAFSKKDKDQDGAYAFSIKEMLDKFKILQERGAKTILLQGGVNKDLPFEYYLELVRQTKNAIPELHMHFFSPIEIIGMAQVSGLTIRAVLKKLRDAGLKTIPGGGAEILSDRVRKRISPNKGSSKEWLDVMRIAHSLGYTTTATMMYGHLETSDDIMIHFESLRALQDETRGFSAFIPWSFKPHNTALEKVIADHAGGYQYLTIIALARIYLDNFPHVQASWFSEGKKIGQIALHFGADDFGGTLIEEHVHKAASFVNTISECEVIDLIKEAGFIPQERTTLYAVV